MFRTNALRNAVLAGVAVVATTLLTAATPATLPNTGVDLSWLLWVAIGVLVVGGGLWFLARRRR